MNRPNLSDSRVFTRLFLVSLLALVLLFGSVSAPALGAEKVKIGSLMALSGGLSKYGPPIKNGALLAVKDLNDAGGVLGKEVDLVVKDTATKPSVGRDAASKLVNIEGVPVIIGALSSGVTRTVSSITSANQTVLISPSATSPAITNLEDNDYTFRTAIPDKFQGRVLAKVASNLGYEKVSVIFVNNSYGKGLAGIVKKNFEKAGGKITAMVPYKQNLPTYGGEAAKAVEENPDAILVIGYPTGGNKLLQKIIELGYEGNYLFPDGMKGEGVAPGPTCPVDGPASEQYISGSYGTAPTSSAPAADKFKKAYNDEFGPSAVPFKAQAYDATVVAALAI
ncbi:MAG: ABC transporter substrate-binding protein, partial [Candidatus Bipolaricaulia bacterium]